MGGLRCSAGICRRLAGEVSRVCGGRIESGLVTPWEGVRGQVVLGNEGFWERVKGKWSSKRARIGSSPRVEGVGENGPGYGVT